MPIRYCLATAVYCAAIFWLSANPEPPGAGLSSTFLDRIAQILQLDGQRIKGADKIAHMVLFGGLSAVVAVGLRRSRRCHGRDVLFFVPVAFASVYGVLDEIHQLWVPLRSFDPWDIAANTGGAILAAWVLLQWWPPRANGTAAGNGA